MQRTISLKENRDFGRVYRRGKSIAGDCLVLYYRKNNLGMNRLGLTASKKVGKAVVRNRVRRLIKENFRLLEDKIPLSYDLVIVARVKAAGSDYQKIGGCLRYLLRKSSLL
ncbi:ribonuclease P protein component [Acetivibrio sp. MSJd-27]|uniref:ribonuclease P protein component n=1 Tax=Acetivibrio sp. MSJd-27 TaxID=2841523 RepID=UPI001C0FA902|nr:ribonuclease P protein component [Acetivibrio sp. MSJd-27]MBU5449547.1 ribonuclease P protein component [Acetivibrio sp. MSJd-27]